MEHGALKVAANLKSQTNFASLRPRLPRAGSRELLNPQSDPTEGSSTKLNPKSAIRN